MNDTFRHRGVLVGEHVRVAAVGTETALGPVVDADAAPLQTAGGPELLAREQYGGPESGFDTRMYLDAAQLERLLDVARASPTRRVKLDLVGVTARLYRGRDGHVYSVWSIVHLPPRAEPAPLPFARR